MVARVRKRDGEAKVQGDRSTEGIGDNRNSAFRVRKAKKSGETYRWMRMCDEGKTRERR